MGPHPLWLMEALCQRRPPTPGTLVLDLGCGKALTSVFLAREFDVRVVAADWWIPALENQQRLVAAGAAERVTPIRAEAHSLPLAGAQFDAIVSVDAYHYFGTADLYLAEMTRLLRPGGWIGIVVPGLQIRAAGTPAAGVGVALAMGLLQFSQPRVVVPSLGQDRTGHRGRRLVDGGRPPLVAGVGSPC